MGVRFPVSVRIDDGITDRHFTGYVSQLKWKITAPGGYHSASMTLHIDPATLSDLGPADRVYIYGPNGNALWEGFIDNPGRLDGDEGVGFELSAIGTVALAGDQVRALIYADRDLGAWEPFARNINAASASTSDDPNDVETTDGLLTQFNRQAINTGAYAQIGYSRLAQAGMQLGSIYARLKSGKSDSGYRNQIVYAGLGVTPGTVDFNTAITTTLTAGAAVVGGAIPPGSSAVAVRLLRTGGATNIADDNTWTWFTDLVVIGRRMNRYGTMLTGLTGPLGMSSLTEVRGDWVVEDLLGRVLTLCDPNASTVDPASYLIDQLAYPDGATAADILDDLAVFEPDMLWEVLHSTAAGYVFNYRAWPTTVRYEVSTRDGYDAPGADVDLCNRVAVRWVDPKGLAQTTIVTATSAQYPALKALEDAGRIRDAETVTLPDGRGSAANAQRAGEQALALKADPPKAATVTVRRPVTDLLRGGWAKPYELEPGYLARVRETGDVLRVTEVEVDDDAGVAVLTLGEPVLTEEQRFAQLAKVARRAA